MENKIIPIFVPHEGCPHDCIFCNQRKITGLSTTMSAEAAEKIIVDSLKTIKEGVNIEIAFFGGSFTAIEIDKQRELLEVAKKYKDRGKVFDIRLSTRPDCITEENLEFLRSMGVTIIELGVQSMVEDVLESSLRGHSRDIVYSSSELIKSFGFKLGLQMMLGLPSDSETNCLFTAREFIKIGPDFVRIYPTLVIRETGLEFEFKKGEYSPFSLEESIEITKKLMVMFYCNNIDIIRVGLQSTEDIQEGIDVVAGPYHPAFRELVKSRMFYDYLISILPNKISSLVVYARNRDISFIVGNKKINKNRIMKDYGIVFKTMVHEKDTVVVEVDGEVLKEVDEKDIYLKLSDIYGV